MYYEKLTWPALPEYMHAELIEYSKTAKNIRPKVAFGNSSYHHYNVPLHVKEWCWENLPISKDKHIIHLQRIFGVDSVWKHVDNPRTDNNMYFLTDSGVTVRWFDDNENMLDSTQFSLHEWYSLNVTAIHDAVNIKGDMVALTIYEYKSPRNRTLTRAN